MQMEDASDVKESIQAVHCMAFQIMITSIIINVTISSTMIGLKNSYFLLIHLPRLRVV